MPHLRRTENFFQLRAQAVLLRVASHRGRAAGKLERLMQVEVPVRPCAVSSKLPR